MNRAALVIAFLSAILAYGEDGPGREALLGVWQVQHAASVDTWSLKSNGGTLSLMRNENGAVTLQAECKTNGSECQGKDENKKAKFSLYFNGHNLVVFETQDSGVIKRRFSVDGTGATMTLEVEPVTGPGKRETLHLTRMLQASVSHE